MSNRDHESVRGHLDGLECGAGCTEIWEHLSEEREDHGEGVADD